MEIQLEMALLKDSLLISHYLVAGNKDDEEIVQNIIAKMKTKKIYQTDQRLLKAIDRLHKLIMELRGFFLSDASSKSHKRRQELKQQIKATLTTQNQRLAKKRINQKRQ